MTPPQTPWQKAADTIFFAQNGWPDNQAIVNLRQVIEAACREHALAETTHLSHLLATAQRQRTTASELSVAQMEMQRALNHAAQLDKENAELKDSVAKMKGILRRFITELDRDHTNAVRMTVGDLGVELEDHMRDALLYSPNHGVKMSNLQISDIARQAATECQDWLLWDYRNGLLERRFQEVANEVCGPLVDMLNQIASNWKSDHLLTQLIDDCLKAHHKEHGP